jgi:putative DNA primase/helicase
MPDEQSAVKAIMRAHGIRRAHLLLGVARHCNPGGAEKWRPEYSATLRGRHVVILPDHDDKGRLHAEQVAQALSGVAASVRVVELPGLGEHGDASDWLAAGHTVGELRDLCLADNKGRNHRRE